MTERTATTIWQGGLNDGSGRTSLDSSGTASFDVSWPRRTGEPEGTTSPEELIAAAHASCFSMAFSGQLGRQDLTPERLEVQATVTFSTDGGPHIAGVVLRVRASVPGASEDTFREAAEAAKSGCPVSKALAGNVDISLDAALD